MTPSGCRGPFAFVTVAGDLVGRTEDAAIATNDLDVGRGRVALQKFLRHEPDLLFVGGEGAGRKFGYPGILQTDSAFNKQDRVFRVNMVLHGRDVLLGRGPKLNLIRRRQRLPRDQLLNLIQPDFELTVIIGQNGNRAVIAGKIESIYQGRKQHLLFPGMVELIRIHAKKANEMNQVLRAALGVDELTHCGPKRIQHPVNQIMLGA